MKSLLTIMTLLLLLSLTVFCQISGILPDPKVKVTISILKDTVKFGDDILLTMTLLNETEQIQSVWFDTPKSSTGGPAWTSVFLINTATGKSPLKYSNKAVLSSQAYSAEEIKTFSYQLKPGQSVTGQFSLYDMVVTNTNSYKLNKGSYVLQVDYLSNSSKSVRFVVD